MYEIVFGLLALVLLPLIWCSVLGHRTPEKQPCSRKEFDVVPFVFDSNNMISIDNALRDNVMKEALEINVRFAKLNEKVKQGDISHEIQIEQLRLHSEMEENVQRSVRMGILGECGSVVSINQR